MLPKYTQIKLGQVKSATFPIILSKMPVSQMGHLAIQVILNIAVVTNTIPNTGITLPFISYGGTSVVFLLGEMGLALGVSSHRKGIYAYNRR